jgi:methylthioribose-1-phosphate isomerase
MVSVEWKGGIDGSLRLLDQTLLPLHQQFIDCSSVDQVWEAIRMLRVRGAPAIGIAAAYGVCIGAQVDSCVPATIAQAGREASERLRTSRPTAVNLFWALDRMERTIAEFAESSNGEELREALLREATAIREEDKSMCHAIGEHGAALFPKGGQILTHCNAGGLATAEYGTALAVFFTLQDQGKSLHVWVDETRPLLQGARLTAWELMQRKVPCTLICDNMAAQVMREGRVDAVVVGADRITARGDAANKIGTYGVAVLAHHHRIPFYVAAPTSTFDLSLQEGSQIPIEERMASEVTNGMGRQTAPDGVPVYNPAFDVTPAELIQGLITEKGIIHPVTPEAIARMLG